MTRPSQHFNERYASLWWVDGPTEARVTEDVLAQWQAVGVDPATIEKVRTLSSRSFDGTLAIWTALEKTLSKKEKTDFDAIEERTRVEVGRARLLGPVRAIRAAGWLGNSMVIVPAAKLVAVRMHVWKDNDGDDAQEARVSYATFTKDVRALAGDRSP